MNLPKTPIDGSMIPNQETIKTAKNADKIEPKIETPNQDG